MRLERYLLRIFISLFLSLFATLFMLSSLVFIVRLADVTSIASIDINDFVTLYIFGIPQLLFYTLPIAFFLAAGLAYARLSFERELVAIFALGADMKNVLSPIAKTAAVVSIVLLFVGYFLTPYSTAVAKNFLENKKTTSKLNIRPSEAGQKFGDWLVFVSQNDKGIFKNIVLFSASSKSSFLDANTSAEKNVTNVISAKTAELTNAHGIPVLSMNGGKAYRVEDLNAARVVEFSSMKISSEMKSPDFDAGNFVSYWQEAFHDKKRAKDFSDVFVTSLFPIASLFFIPAVSIVNPRYQKNRVPMYLILLTVLFYLLMLVINPILTFFGALLIVPLWTFLGYTVYKKSACTRF